MCTRYVWEGGGGGERREGGGHDGHYFQHQRVRGPQLAAAIATLAIQLPCAIRGQVS